MARYIDADAMIEAIKNELWDWQSLDDITATCVLKQTITDIQNAPTADVVDKERYANLLANSIIVCEALKKYQSTDMVQVVRCKDCQFWKTETEVTGIECAPGESAHYCKLDGMIWRSGDFCSSGDRKGNSNGKN